MLINFPGNKQVEAQYKGFTIQTDQPVKEGGDGLAPSPFDLFLSSIGTCAGFYVLSFCQERNIPLNGLSLVLNTTSDKVSHMVTNISIDIKLPKNFPEKYLKSIKTAADLCTVKKHMFNPPVFDINAVIANE